MVKNLKRLSEYREEHDALLQQQRIEAGETDNTASSETDSGYTSESTLDSSDIKWMPHLKPEYKACLRKQEAIKSMTHEGAREVRDRRRQKEHDLRAKRKLVSEWVDDDHAGASTS
jgi:DNA-directed RNA polymerase sigma subunit (sigma70/sigma32)